MISGSRKDKDTLSQSTGIIGGHCYTIVETKEINHRNKKVQLIKLRNYCDEMEWDGAWSD
jgi:hypothetical protein